MKSSANSNSTEETTTKTAPAKTSKKATRSRAKANKTENCKKSGTAANNNSGTNNSNNKNSDGDLTTAPANPNTLEESMTTGTAYDSSSVCSGHNNTESSGQNNTESSSSGSPRCQQKSYAGLDPRSIKIIWEQHDQSDVGLYAGVCEHLAEDASYKLWEIINSIKTYARHSGGEVTYDLVNEVLGDSDVPPMLGAMDSSWDRIDYDGSFFFYSDKIIELRDEYQKNITITMPLGPDYVCSWPVEEKNTEIIKQYIPAIIYVSLFGDSDDFDILLNEVAVSPIIGSCYRVILAKLIQILAFEQSDPVSLRCWSLLRTLVFNPYTRDVDCREEYFHLAEILICQLLAPYETIKVHAVTTESDQGTSHEQAEPTTPSEMEIDDVKPEITPQEEKNEFTDEQLCGSQSATDMQQSEEKIFLLLPDDDEEVDASKNTSMTSAYFATPVDWDHVDVLCQTIGQMAATNGFFQSECLFLVVRRLERFFDGRNICTEKEYNYISRVVRCLISLGEYAFREFIPFIYKFEPANVPENLWTDFATAAIFLTGADDIFLYEWLEFLCGADKLQPFLVYYAQYHEKMLTYRFDHRRLPTYKICPKMGVRRLEWSTLAAAMCHGDDPNKALKPKPSINDYFPELTAPNLHLNRPGTIRFKFSGCRPIIIKPKVCQQNPKQAPDLTTGTDGISSTGATTATSLQKDILIARRKLYKPLTDERRVSPLSSYYFVKI